MTAVTLQAACGTSAHQRYVWQLDEERACGTNGHIVLVGPGAGYAPPPGSYRETVQAYLERGRGLTMALACPETTPAPAGKARRWAWAWLPHTGAIWESKKANKHGRFVPLLEGVEPRPEASAKLAVDLGYLQLAMGYTGARQFFHGEWDALPIVYLRSDDGSREAVIAGVRP